ncbi:MAG: MBL fold metallo-hydrolase, partial [Pseudomonadota bacterium]
DLTASLVTDVTNGTLSLNADGSFDYTPDAGFFGEDSFVYAVTDGEATQNATATITVEEFADQGSAGRDRFAGREGLDDTFVFEVGELCIGHLGHLHHLLSENHYAQLGRIDVVMAPVDGTFTLNVEDMISILKRLRSRVVLPMHAFGSYSMRLFLDGMSDAFRIAHSDQRVLRISATTLPEDPTVIVLANHFWRGGDD